MKDAFVWAFGSHDSEAIENDMETGMIVRNRRLSAWSL